MKACTKASLLFLLSAVLSAALAKEFVATSEWQVLPPEDSIPAGLHVRVDMTTGQRMAKLSVEGDDDLITTQDQVESMRRTVAMGSGVVAIPEERDAGDKFDYEMMYRMYARIPAGEKPNLPDRAALGEEQWKVEMRALWDERQLSIKSVMESIADVPDILSSLIDSLSDSSLTAKEQGETLDDLEYLLTDIDVARDFYILRGWPRLLAVLANPSLGSPLRAKAALCVGNAVSNNDEFHGWSVAKAAGEDGSEGLDVVQLLTSVLGRETDENLLRKSVYALASVLRGNPTAAARFVEVSGGIKVHHLLSTQSHDRALMAKLLTLANDVIDASAEENETSSALLPTFTGNAWCAVARDVLKSETKINAQEKVLLSLRQLLPTCDLTSVEQTKLKGVVARLKDGWVKAFADGSLDGDYRRELDELAEGIFAVLAN
jgi:nucleotide exchange factor SIL1